MKWRGGRVSREDFTKQKMLEMGFKGYVGVFRADSGGREFQAEGSYIKSVSEVGNA